MMPKSGGVYLYLREAYGERLAFMCGFANFTLGNSGSIAALAVAFAAALSSMVPLDEWTQKSIAVGLVVLLTAVNIRGIKAGSTVQSIFLVLKMLPIVLILFAGLFMGTESPDLFAMPAETPSLMNILSMVGFAVIATLWAYEGWTNLNVIGEEIRNPKRNIPALDHHLDRRRGAPLRALQLRRLPRDPVRCDPADGCLGQLLPRHGRR